MAPKKANCTPKLGIQLDSTETHYRPGDTITGRVYRETKSVNSDAFVNISLHGRTATRITVSTGDSDYVYDMHINLLNDRDNVHTLRNPSCIPREGGKGLRLEWPFKLTIPTHVDPAALSGSRLQEAFLLLDKESVRGELLPASFYRETWGARKFGTIEYFLEVSLPIQRDASIARVASLPVQVHRFHDGHPLVPIDDTLAAHIKNLSVTSQRLIPGMRDAKLSIIHRMRNKLGASNGPKLSFQLELMFPQIIAMDNLPFVLPFHLRAIPVWDETEEILKNVLQTLKLDIIKLSLISIFKLRCKQGKEGEYFDESGHVSVPLVNYGHLADSGSSKAIQIPCSEEAGPSYNVGKVMNVLVMKQTQSKDVPQLHHDFVTYNIQHTHHWRYSLRFKVAGETVRADGEVPVKVLPPSDPNHTEVSGEN